MPSGPFFASFRSRSRPWGYDPQSSRRDLRLDFLRGLCLLKMVLNHLWRTPLHGIQGWIGFVTAAEGFFFISGVVVGIVQGRRCRERGFAVTSRAMVVRAGQLYASNLALVFLFASLEAGGWIGERRFLFLWDGGFHWPRLFHFGQPYFLHVLPRYVVFLLMTPAALWALLRGKTRWLLAISSGLWLAYQILGDALRIPFVEPPIGFPVLAWQLLFFVGMTLGFHREKLSALWRSWRGDRRLALLLGGSLAFVALLQVLEGGPPGAAGDLLVPWVNRQTLGPLRLVNLAVGFALLFELTDRFWKPLRTLAGPLLLPYGQASLFLFLIHIPVVWLSAELVGALPRGPAGGAAWYLLADALLVLFLLQLIRSPRLSQWVPR